MSPKVMIIDDDPIMGTMLESRLGDYGFESHYFNTGAEALDKVIGLSPDIIISDIIMPNMDGYELHNNLRRKPETAGIPFVFLSAKTHVTDQLEGLRLGADDYVCKPFEMDDLISRMKKVMDRASAAKSYRTMADFSGNLSQMSLNDIFQIVEMNYKSGELIINDGGGKKIGSVFFKDGGIINAFHGKLTGEEAFFGLMEKKYGFFEFFGNSAVVDEKITEGNMSVLLKGSRLLDESEAFFEQHGDLDDIPVLTTSEFPRKVVERAGREPLKKILVYLRKKHSLREMFGSGILSRPTMASILGDLIEAGLLHLEKGKPKTEAAAEIVFTKGLLRTIVELEKEAATGILEVEGTDSGRIYLAEGKIIDAEKGTARAKKALFRLMGRNPVSLVFHRKKIAVDQVIGESNARLMDEGLRQNSAFDLPDSAIFDKIVSTVSGVEPTDPDIERYWSTEAFVQTVGGGVRIREIIEASPMTDLATYELLIRLIDRRLLTLADQSRTEIRLVTDSGADLPPEIVENRFITLAPNSITFGEKTYFDGINITPERFYEYTGKMGKPDAVFPPSVDEFDTIFRETLEDQNLLGIFISRKLGGVYRNARAAKEKHIDGYMEMRKKKTGQKRLGLEIINSRTISMGTGLLVMEAADKLAKNWSMNRIVSHIERLVPLVRFYFILETSDYLREASWMEDVAGLRKQFRHSRPIFSVVEEKITIVGQLREKEDSFQAMLKLLKKTTDVYPEIRSAVLHGDRPEWAAKMGETIRREINCREVVVTPVGAFMGAHCGPGTLAVACLPVLDPCGGEI